MHLILNSSTGTLPPRGYISQAKSAHTPQNMLNMLEVKVQIARWHQGGKHEKKGSV